MPTTGMTLKLRRVEARVSITDLAARMGRSRATLHRYEGLAVVPADIVQLYIESLGTSRDVTKTETAA